MLSMIDPRGDTDALNTLKASLKSGPEYIFVCSDCKELEGPYPKGQLKKKQIELIDTIIKKSDLTWIGYSKRSGMPPVFSFRRNDELLELILFVSGGKNIKSRNNLSWISMEIEYLAVMMEFKDIPKVLVPTRMLTSFRDITLSAELATSTQEDMERLAYRLREHSDTLPKPPLSDYYPWTK